MLDLNIETRRVVLEIILSYTSDAKDYKNFRLVDKQWNLILDELYPDGDKFINHLTTILKLLPDKEWDYWNLSGNPNITWEYIKANPKKIWSSARLSGNPNITWDIVVNNPNYPWNIEWLSRNPNITWDIIQSNPNYDWSYGALSENPNITWDNIRNNLDKSWNFRVLSFHPNITWEIIVNNPDLEWDFEWVAKNKNITWDIVKNNPNYHWNYELLTGNPNITWKIIENNPYIPWDYGFHLGRNPNIGIEHISKIKYQKGIEALYIRSRLGYKYIFDHPETQWDNLYLSLCYNNYKTALTWKMVLEHETFWDYRFLFNKDFL